jgi:hypothetical protein
MEKIPVPQFCNVLQLQCSSRSGWSVFFPFVASSAILLPTPASFASFLEPVFPLGVQLVKKLILFYFRM